MSRTTLLLAVACCLLPAVASHAADDWRDSPFHREGFYAGLSGSYFFDQGMQEALEDAFTDATRTYNNARKAPSEVLEKEEVQSFGSVGVNARAGYRFNPWFALEFQAEYVPSIRGEVSVSYKKLEGIPRDPTITSVDDCNPQKMPGTCRMSVITRKVETMTSSHDLLSGTINAKVFFPLGRIQPYAIGGGGLIYSQTIGDYVSYCVRNGECDPDTPSTRPLDAGKGILENGIDFAFRAGGGVDIYLTEHFLLNWEAGAMLPIGRLQNLNYYFLNWGLQYRF
jgi:opacity protein-like surface antigen